VLVVAIFLIFFSDLSAICSCRKILNLIQGRLLECPTLCVTRQAVLVDLYRTNEKVSSIKCSNFSPILRIVSMAEIGRSGKPVLLKEDPP
jgi:hypothetical protein